jgi:pimeloyl-ACP methyl ester carboxylesterase
MFYLEGRMPLLSELGTVSAVRLGDAEIAYREFGSGRPIVFVHGVLVNGNLWRDVVPLLADRYRCIVPDWPLGSHAIPMPPLRRDDRDLSPPGIARLVADFLEALALDDVVLVACDTGGAIAQLVVTAHPDRVGALVLTNCDAFENFFPPAFRALTWCSRIPGFVDALVFAMRWTLLQRLVCATVAHRRPTPELLHSYFDRLLADAAVRRDLRDVLASVHRRYTLEAARHFAAFTKPVGIAWGEDDRLFFPMRYAERLRDAFPSARLRTFAGAMTFVSEDRPVELAAFVAEIAGAVTS